MRKFDWATIQVLTLRELKRFFRQKSRIAGALMQPILFWIILGFGFRSSFQMGVGSSVDYVQYFFPGVISMMILFTAIFSTMSIIEDRREGFLQGVLAAPSGRHALVIGKVLGGSLVSLVQVALFLLLAPLAKFSYGTISWIPLFTILFFTAVFLTSFGFFLAWWTNSVQGYHAIMSVVLMPMWLLSGAVFPIDPSIKILSYLSYLNPMSYSADAIRMALYGMQPPTQTLRFSLGYPRELLTVCVFVAIAMTWAIFICQRTKQASAT